MVSGFEHSVANGVASRIYRRTGLSRRVRQGASLSKLKWKGVGVGQGRENAEIRATGRIVLMCLGKGNYSPLEPFLKCVFHSSILFVSNPSICSISLPCLIARSGVHSDFWPPQSANISMSFMLCNG